MQTKRVNVQVIFSALIISVLLLSVWAGSSKAARLGVAPQIDKVYINDIRDNSLVVSWTTDILSTGKVQWYDYDLAAWIDAIDWAGSTTTHYVVISGVDPDTTIELRIVSESGGDVTIDDNGGLNYSVTLGAALTPPVSPLNAWGFLYLSDTSTPVADAVVYLRLVDTDGLGSLGESQWHAARTNGSGFWAYDTMGIRTQDAQSYFEFTPGVDDIQLVWQGGINGAVGEVGDERYFDSPAVDFTQYNMFLDDNPTAINLQRFEAASPQSQLWVLLVAGLLSIPLLSGLVHLAWLRRKAA